MARKEVPPRSNLIREWIVFALCLGFGGHLAFAVVLHAPERWPWGHAGLYGLVLGLGVYVTVQLIRTLWWALRGRSETESLSESE